MKPWSTAIVGAYYLGTSLMPETKMYRFLADIMNDFAVIIDVLSPVLGALFPWARVVGLCTSAVLRALCGIVAGGSKTAISLHFSTPSTGLGDLGDLNAKDSSKETVLALAGMLVSNLLYSASNEFIVNPQLGSFTIPLITSLWATYTSLFILVILHLTINYYAVRGLALRHLNRQRAPIAWLLYKAHKKAPTPQQVAEHEFIFDRPGIIRDPSTHHIIGVFHMGSAPLDVLCGSTLSFAFLHKFRNQNYIVCFDPKTSFSTNAADKLDHYPIVHVCFREKFTAEDQLKGWLHAVEICRRCASQKISNLQNPEAQVELITSTHEDINSFPVAKDFLGELKRAGWNTSESYVMAGSDPKALLSTYVLIPAENSSKAILNQDILG